MARAAAGVLRGKHCPRGSVTWAPAFAGVTLVGEVRERLTIAVKSKPTIQHRRHARVARPLRPELVEGRPRRPWFDGLTTEDRSNRKGRLT